MDAVGFTFPVDLAPAAKLIGSVSVKELEPYSNSLLREKSSAHTINGSEVTSWNKLSGSQPPKHDNRLSIEQGESACGTLHSRCKNGILLNPKLEVGHVERKTTKYSRSSGSCPKRPRVALIQDPSTVRIDGVQGVSQQFGLCTLKCPSSEKPQLAKQRNGLSKRGDKRSPRVPIKPKNESVSGKSGLTCFGSTAGGSNFFGIYGLKSENLDATKHVDDLPLNELLCGNHQHASSGKDKEKKPVNGNENFLDLVRKSCSMLQPPRSIQSQNFAETDSCSNKKMSPWLLSSNSIEDIGINGDTRDSPSVDMPSSSKDTFVKSETAVDPPGSPLLRPLKILQRLMLPPPKDLESLLLDATKPPLASKSISDARQGKQQVGRRVSLPPFPWSHMSSGHCRASSDAVKLSTIKGTCPGRWLKVGKDNTSSLGNVTDLESLTYDQSLVPSGLKAVCLENVIPSSLSERECDSLASCSKGTCSTLVSGVKMDESGNAGKCPKLLSAAQTLYDIATHTPRQNLDRHIRWPQKSSQKSMKARKLKSIEKTSEPHHHNHHHPTSVPTPRAESLGRRDEVNLNPSKKPKLAENKRDSNNQPRKESSAAWSAPRSSRPSLGKTAKDSTAEPRYTYMMPPPPMRAPENNAVNGQHSKLRKLMPFEWNRGRESRDRLD